jgi:hypothetical protein
MRKTLLLAVLGLALVCVAAIPVYAYNLRFSWMNQMAWRRIQGSLAPSSQCANEARNFTWAFRYSWRRAVGGELPRGLNRFSVELSDEFKNRVLEIAGNDNDVQSLLSSGYEVKDIRPIHVKLTVQGDGQVAMYVDKVLLVLAKGDHNRAFVDIDFEAGKVVRIVNVTDKTAIGTETTTAP